MPFKTRCIVTKLLQSNNVESNLNFELVPVSIVNEALQLPNKVCHRRSHLNFLFRMEQAAEMKRSHFERAVTTQNRFGYYL